MCQKDTARMGIDALKSAAEVEGERVKKVGA
jgi:hypothetical protein